MLDGKKIVLGVSGGIACYKACELVSRLKKQGAEVDVIMTDNACNFVSPLTFQTLAKSAVITNQFKPVETFDVKHVSLAKKADIIVVAPATANVIAKFANGIADDMLTTTYLASKAIKLICPAMNEGMYTAEITQHNIKSLSSSGVHFVGPATGALACGDVGVGRMAEPFEIEAEIIKLLCPNRDLEGKKLLITAGGSSEDIDPVRFIANRSSGKMGISVAEAAIERGAQVTLVYGNISVPLPKGAICIHAQSALDMLEICREKFADCDIAVMAAAVADYRPAQKSTQKIKGDKITLQLEKNPDIAAELGKIKGDKKLVVFAAETQDVVKNATDKLLKKNADMAVANDVTLDGAGFECDTNIVTFITKDGAQFIDKAPKRVIADLILDKVLEL